MHHRDQSKKQEYKYPVTIIVVMVVGTIVPICLFISLCLHYCYEAYKEIISVGFWECLLGIKDVSIRLISTLSPVNSAILVFITCFFIYAFVMFIKESISILKTPVRFNLDDYSFSFLGLTGKKHISISEIVHMEEKTKGMVLYYVSNNKTKDFYVSDNLINYPVFVEKIKNALVTANGLYFNKELHRKIEYSNKDLLKSNILLLCIGLFFFLILSLPSNIIKDSYNWINLIYLAAFILIISASLFLLSLHFCDISYENGNIWINYRFIKKRSFHFRIEDIQRAKKTNNTTYVIYYRKNNSLKKLTLDNKPVDGKDVLFTELQNRALLK